MLKFFREWLKDLNEAQKELNEAGLYSIFTPWGTYWSQIVNTQHDKSKTIRENDRDPES